MRTSNHTNIIVWVYVRFIFNLNADCCWCMDCILMMWREHALQDFTVLPTKTFRLCVIRSLSVIFLPTSSPTDYVRRLYLHRLFPIPSLYRSEKQKNHLPMVLLTEFARKKKKIPAWNIPMDFYSVGILWLTDGQ
jgi:hypothetical protein